MAACFVSRGSNMLRRALFHKPSKILVYSEIRGFTSDARTAQDEYKFETLTGELEGKIVTFFRLPPVHLISVM